jgi:autotransporter-associated beta strand protein
MCGSLSAKLLCFVAALSLLPSAAIAQVQINQMFVPQGPSPIITTQNLLPQGSPIALPIATTSGAVQAILLDTALGPNTMFIGSPNGGIWETTNGGSTWTALTNNQASLSIASLGLDTTDPTGKTLIAGVGITSSGLWGTSGFTGRGGQQTGLLLTTDGGKDWTSIGATTLAGQSVIGVAATGSGTTMTIMAATFEATAPTITTVGTSCATSCEYYGLYISHDGGQTFNLLNSPPTLGGPVLSPLPAGPATALVADPDPKMSGTFYAAFTSPTTASVWVTTNDGATWSNIFTKDTTKCDQVVLKLAAGPYNSLAIAVVDVTTNTLTNLYMSPDGGKTWSALPNPLVQNGQTIQGDASNLTHLALAVNRTSHTSTPIVYVAGSDTIPSLFPGYPAPIFQIQGQNVTNLTCQPAPNGGCTYVHADTRALVIDAAGNLLIGSDGGVSKLSNGVWTGLNNTLQITEPYAVAYGANAHLLAVAAQDVSVAIQSAPNNPSYRMITGGDGHVAVVNDKNFLGYSVYYTADQNLDELARLAVDSQGNSPHGTTPTPAGVPVTCTAASTAPEPCGIATGGGNGPVTLALNSYDPTRMALSSGFDVFVARDTALVTATSVNLTLTDLGYGIVLVPQGPIKRALAYGASDNPNVLLAGGPGPNSLYLSVAPSTSPITAMSPLTPVTTYTGGLPTSIVFGPSSQAFYVADGVNLWSTTNQGATITQLLLPTGFTRPTATEFISNNGVNALLVGGLNTPLTCTSAPNGCVISPAQSPIVYFNSDAAGNLSSFNWFGQGLPNALVSQIAYNSIADVLAIASVGRGVFTLYDVTSYFPQATVLQFGLANNDSMPDAKFLTDGTVGNRPLIKYGTGTLTITGDATYSGSTTVNGGTLEVDGVISNTSSVAVNSTGTLSGAGTVDPLVVSINTGGTFAPGTPGVPGTSMNIVGNLAFQSGAYYLVQLNATTSTFANVSGTASLGGTVEAVFSPGTVVPAHQYTILVSGGLTGTTFVSLAAANLPVNFNANLTYTPDDVLLNMTAALGASAGLNTNQQNVATSLNNFFNSGGTLPPNFAAVFGLSGLSLANALTQLSGAVATDAEHGAFQLMTEFLGLMLDPFVDGRLGSGNGQAMGFAPDEQASLPPDIALAYASILKKAPPQPTFDQRWTAWGAAYGGSNSANGNAAAGSSNVTANTFGFAGGMDYHVTPNTVVGFALAGGGLNWGLSTGGTGRSDAFQAGVYGTTHAGPAYLAGALAFANHWFTTNRSALGDQLTANFVGQSYGARAELFLATNWSLIAKFDGEFAPGSQTYAGTGTLRYTW